MSAEIDELEFWSHISVECLGDVPRIIRGAWDNYLLEPLPNAPFLVLLHDTDGFEWLCELKRNSVEAVSCAAEEAVKFGNLRIDLTALTGNC